MGANRYDSISYKSKGKVMFAKYVEEAHKAFLDISFQYAGSIIDHSPYEGYESPDFDIGFFADGVVLGSYNPLMEEFGTTMLGIDIVRLFEQAISEVITRERLSELEDAEIDLINSTYNDERAEVGRYYRDINAVNSSSFAVAKGVVEDKFVKDTLKVRLAAADALLKKSSTNATTRLAYAEAIMAVVSNATKEYFLNKELERDVLDKMVIQHTLWVFYILDWERKFLNSLRNASKETKMTMTDFTHSRYYRVNNVMMQIGSGAMIGNMIVPGYGAAVGAAVGNALGLAESYGRDDRMYFSAAVALMTADPVATFVASGGDFKLLLSDLFNW